MASGPSISARCDWARSTNGTAGSARSARRALERRQRTADRCNACRRFRFVKDVDGDVRDRRPGGWEAEAQTPDTDSSACGPSPARRRRARAFGGGAPNALRNADRVARFGFLQLFELTSPRFGSRRDSVRLLDRDEDRRVLSCCRFVTPRSPLITGRAHGRGQPEGQCDCSESGALMRGVESRLQCGSFVTTSPGSTRRRIV